MPVEFWTGGPFKTSHERLAQNRLTESLQAAFAQSEETIFALFNVAITGKDLTAADMDLLILKRDAIIIVDFKECGLPVTATENGAWQISSGGRLNGNPFQQVRHFRFSLNTYLLEHKHEFLPKQKTSGLTNQYAFLNFIRSVVALCPQMHPETVNRITSNPWFYISGLDRLPELIRAITSSAFLLNDSEMRSLATDVLRAESLFDRPTESPSAPGEEMAPEQIAPNIRRHIRDYSTIIEDKTRDFVGRRFVLDEIDAFLASEKRGYFFLVGDPGIGKSAVAARLVADRGFIHHFNIRAEGINRTEAFLANVCAQLIARYHLPYDSLPPETTNDASVLNVLLKDDLVHNTSPDHKTVIVVDALDEVDKTAARPGTNLLCLPTIVPEGTYFIVTTRRSADIPRLDCEYRVKELSHDSQDNLRDIEECIALRAQRARVQSYIADQRLTVKEFINLMVEKSEGNFIYLRHVLPEIEAGTYLGLDHRIIPSGLRSYYDDHWRRMRAGAETTWFERKLPVLAALTAIQEPVSLELLCEFSGIRERAYVQAVLGEWQGFLHVVPVDTDGGQIANRFCIYHSSYFDYLKEKEDVSAERFDLKAAHKRIADTLWANLNP